MASTVATSDEETLSQKTVTSLPVSELVPEQHWPQSSEQVSKQAPNQLSEQTLASKTSTDSAQKSGQASDATSIQISVSMGSKEQNNSNISQAQSSHTNAAAQEHNVSSPNAVEKKDTTVPTLSEKMEQPLTSTQTTQMTQTAPPLPSDASFTWGGYFQSIGILMILLAALWVVVWFLRKYGRFNFIPRPGSFPHDGLRLEAQLPLGPKKGLAVVRFLNKRLLVGITDQQITLLQEVKDNDDSMEFKELMEKFHEQDTQQSS